MDGKQITENDIVELYNKEYQDLVNFFFNKCGDDATARDLVQTLFLRFLERVRDGGIRKETVRSYLWSAAYNEYYSYFRKFSNKELQLEEPEILPAEMDASKQEISSLILATLYDAVQSHPDPLIKKVLSMRYLEKKRAVEVAQEIGKSRDTVDRLCKKGIRHVVEYFKKADITLADLNQ